MAGIEQYINGSVYDYHCIEIDLGGTIETEISEISYKHSLTPGELKGTKPYTLAHTQGEYKADAGSMTMSLAAWNRITEALGEGYLAVPLPITVTYANDGQPTQKDELIGCRLIGPDKGYKQGGDALMVKVGFKPLRIRENGREALPTTR